MKIGIDFRFIEDGLYSDFLVQIFEKFIEKKQDYNFIIYVNKNLKTFENYKNVNLKIVKIKLGSFAEQIKFRKILKEDKNDLMFFFNQYKPIFYKKNYITFCLTLKDFYYENFSSFLEKHIFFFLADKNFKNSMKMICLDSKTREELIEKFNIKYEDIEVLHGFFPKKKYFDYKGKIEKTSLDIATKYFINNKFFIYSAGVGIEKNYEKLISVFHRLKKEGEEIDLVFIGDGISKNVNLRNIILEKEMQKNIFFLGKPSLKDKKYLYGESLGVIFPSFYEPFPFKLTDPLYFNTPIISSDLKKIKQIFDDEIDYFSPISENSIYENIKKYLENLGSKNPNYDFIIRDYNLENTFLEFEKIFLEMYGKV